MFSLWKIQKCLHSFETAQIIAASSYFMGAVWVTFYSGCSNVILPAAGFLTGALGVPLITYWDWVRLTHSKVRFIESTMEPKQHVKVLSGSLMGLSATVLKISSDIYEHKTINYESIKNDFSSSVMSISINTFRGLFVDTMRSLSVILEEVYKHEDFRREILSLNGFCEVTSGVLIGASLGRVADFLVDTYPMITYHTSWFLMDWAISAAMIKLADIYFNPGELPLSKVILASGALAVVVKSRSDNSDEVMSNLVGVNENQDEESMFAF